MAQTLICRGRATKVFYNAAEKTLSVTYHSTEIVKVIDGTITLNNGGYFTTTTKLRMNQASAQYGLGYGVYQKKGKWYFDVAGWITGHEYHHGTTFSAPADWGKRY